MFDPALKRDRLNKLFTAVASLFAAIAVLPLFLVLIFVLIQGGRLLSLQLLTQLPPAPGLEEVPSARGCPPEASSE